jgi:uncharacterized protein YigA (DUF484 family)
MFHHHDDCCPDCNAYNRARQILTEMSDLMSQAQDQYNALVSELTPLVAQLAAAAVAPDVPLDVTGGTALVAQVQADVAALPVVPPVA